MPRGDGTGPMGIGPATGKGMGYCAGSAMPGYMSGGFGMGRGRGFGRMHCMTGQLRWARSGAYPYMEYPGPSAAPVIDEKEALHNRAAFLEKELNQVRERLEELKEED